MSVTPKHQFNDQKLMLILKLVGLVVVLRFVWVALTKSAAGSSGFARYLLMVIGGTIGIYLIARFIHLFIGIRCPDCNKPMFVTGERNLFSGARGEGGGFFSPIAIRIHKCRKCGKEYHQLFIPTINPGGVGLVVPRDNPLVRSYVLGTHLERYFCEDVTPEPKGMTDEEYQRIRKEIEAKVRAHNLRQGFNTHR